MDEEDKKTEKTEKEEVSKGTASHKKVALKPPKRQGKYFKAIKELFSESSNSNHNAKREQLKMVLALVGVGIICFGIYLYMSQPTAKHKKEQPHLAGAFDDNVGMTYDHEMMNVLTSQLAQTKSAVNKLQDDQKKTNNTSTDQALMKLDASTRKQMEMMQKEIKALKSQLQHSNSESRKKSIPTHKQSTDKGAFTKGKSREQQAKASLPAAPMMPMVSSIGIDDVNISYPDVVKKSQQRNASNYVWAGTFATGYLMTGIIGDAGTNSTKNRGTVAIKLTQNGTMPNGKTSHLKDCVALGSTYGDLSSDSAVIHLETLSCAGKKYSFEKKVYGSVFDLDAMQDLRGKPVLKAKPVLSYAALAGLIAGIGDGLSSSGQTSTVTGSGVVLTPNDAVKSGIGEGISKPADKITDYLMDIADMYHPVVVVHAGRKVTVLFQAGFWIDKAHEKYQSMASINSGDAQKQTSSGDQATHSVVTTAATQLNIGNQALSTSVHPSDITQQVAAASGNVKALADDAASSAFNANQLKLGENPMFTPIHATSDSNHTP